MSHGCETYRNILWEVFTSFAKILRNFLREYRGLPRVPVFLLLVCRDVPDVPTVGVREATPTYDPKIQCFVMAMYIPTRDFAPMDP